jgi:hypothetical protein
LLLPAAACDKLVASCLTCPHDFLFFNLREHVAASLHPCLRRTKGIHNSLKRLVCIAGVFSLVSALSFGMLYLWPCGWAGQKKKYYKGACDVKKQIVRSGLTALAHYQLTGLVSARHEAARM